MEKSNRNKLNSFEHFFIVGAQRSGTTYLYKILDEHPEIQMAKPLKPEPKFFLKDELYKKGLDYYEKHFFTDSINNVLRGEKTTSYIESKKAAKRISNNFPDTKIIFILRNPVYRAISNYWFSFNNGLENLSIEEAFRSEPSRYNNYPKDKISVSPFAYLRRGLYINFIKIYEKYFTREQMKILIFENFLGSEKSVKNLFSFLRIKKDFTPSKLNSIINESNYRKTKLSDEFQSYIYDYFRESNKRLAVEYDIDLSVWEK